MRRPARRRSVFSRVDAVCNPGRNRCMGAGPGGPDAVGTAPGGPIGRRGEPDGCPVRARSGGVGRWPLPGVLTATAGPARHQTYLEPGSRPRWKESTMARLRTWHVIPLAVLAVTAGLSAAAAAPAAAAAAAAKTYTITNLGSLGYAGYDTTEPTAAARWPDTRTRRPPSRSPARAITSRRGCARPTPSTRSCGATAR